MRHNIFDSIPSDIVSGKDNVLYRKYFPVVKECIYQILGMWESERRKQADEDALNKALSAISSSIK